MSDQTTTTDQASATITLVYRLSESGRRAALLAGIPATQYQMIPIPVSAVPASLAGHISVAEDGRGYLTLVRDTGADTLAHSRIGLYAIEHGYDESGQPTYADLDAPILDPAAWLADLAARLPQMRADAVARRKAIDDERHAREAEQSAVRAARDAEQWAARERAKAEAAAREAAEAAKKQARANAIAAWVTKCGTPNQRARFAAGVLPEPEVIDAMADEVFGAVSAARFRAVTREECLAALNPYDAEAIGDDAEVTCDVRDLDALTAAQWDALEAIRAQLPEGAQLKARRIQCGLYDNCRDTDIVRYDIHAKVHSGPFAFVRRFACPGLEE